MKFLEILSLKNLLDVFRPLDMTINGQCESPESITFEESKDQVLDHDQQKADPTKAWCPKCKVHSTEIIPSMVLKMLIFLGTESIPKLYCVSSWDCVVRLVNRTECVISTLNVRCARWVLQTDNGYSRH